MVTDPGSLLEIHRLFSGGPPGGGFTLSHWRHYREWWEDASFSIQKRNCWVSTLATHPPPFLLQNCQNSINEQSNVLQPNNFPVTLRLNRHRPGLNSTGEKDPQQTDFRFMHLMHFHMSHFRKMLNMLMLNCLLCYQLSICISADVLWLCVCLCSASGVF